MYPTRNSEDYSIHKAKKMFSDRSIRITGPTLWNSLVFVKDASLYFTNHGHEPRRRELAITSVKHEAERSGFVKDASLYFTNRGHEPWRRELAITSAKHEAAASEGTIYNI